jgi:hypothetical protein
MLKAPKRRTSKFTALVPLVVVVGIIGAVILPALAATGKARFEFIGSTASWPLLPPTMSFWFSLLSRLNIEGDGVSSGVCFLLKAAESACGLLVLILLSPLTFASRACTQRAF